MSFNGYTVIDADSHIREYVDVDRTYKILGANAQRLFARFD